ncbi:cysteine-rich CWC family protein [Paraglaciecola aquimarina]|uniref:cysteine-rich CWC family protein n=1 Tax=Paraglaciecola aquimarina TaxID=1235557 RepID=UPI003D181DA4
MTEHSICPFCQNQNACNVASREGCWCFDIKVAKSMLDLVPDKKLNKSCICKECIQLFKYNPTEFLSRFVN